MRVGIRITQFRRDPVFKLLRDEMFQSFGLVVNLVPRIVEEIMEETLQQTMVAKNLQSAHLPVCCQTHTVVLFVFHKRRLLCGEFLEHSGHGSSTHTEMLGERVTGHPLLFGAAQFQYRFQIVVYRFRSVRSVASRWH